LEKNNSLIEPELCPSDINWVGTILGAVVSEWWDRRTGS